MSNENGNWCLIESDPGVFTELIHNMGVRDVQVEELYSLDSDTLRGMEPVYGLIFLFKWQGTASHSGSQQRAGKVVDNNDVFFAQQIIQNACATQAILSILLNRESEIELGETLTNFRSFASDLPPDMRGLALTNCDQIREVHNSFVRPESFLTDPDEARRPAGEDDDLFHFISYVPVNGRLYELDGLSRGPVDHGDSADWLERVGEVIQQRMGEYKEGEIRFNLMAVIGDRRKMLTQQISSVDRDISVLMAELEKLRLEESKDVGDVESRIAGLNSERAELEHLVDLENGKFARYRFDNSLRKLNFIPFVYQLARAMAEKGVLEPAVDRAKEKARSRPHRQQRPAM
ncbi:ubiquitin carboxyl-terminal hydrolase [Coemansia sp. RSA 2050]|nr:ubiquitin carboxyl-terminal hydrolase [Coemansia sp. RSA 2050]KAJ2735449.1 ubiquitin carboxyl-terminal hydrolase [Coemansia sp. BCRC 34962]